MKKAKILVVGSVKSSKVDKFALTGWLFQPTTKIPYLHTSESGEAFIFGYSQTELEDISAEFGHGFRFDCPYGVIG